MPELDALRGVAAFLVVLQHARVMGLDPRPLGSPLLDRAVHVLMHFSPLRVLEFGRGAVLFFFVLSGYVLTRALLRNGSPGLLTFAAQRSIRLLIPVAASVCVSLGAYAVVVGDPAELTGALRGHVLNMWLAAPDPWVVLRHVFLLLTDDDVPQLNPVLWSLVPEWRLTLLLPLVLLFRGRAWALVAVGCIGMALGTLDGVPENRIQLGPQFHDTIFAALYFSLGILSGAALALLGPLPRLAPLQRLAGAVTSLALFSLGSDVANYAASVLLILLAQQPGAFRTLLRRQPLLWLGRVSYSLYLVHAPVLASAVILLHGAMPIWASLLLGIGAALPAAAALHRVAEVPAQRLARRVGWLVRDPRSPPEQASPAPPAEPPRPERFAALHVVEGGLPVRLDDPAGGRATTRRQSRAG